MQTRKVYQERGYNLNYMPLPQKCHLAWDQCPIKILRGNNLVQCLKDYTVFNSAEDAEIWAMCFKYDEKQFRIVNTESLCLQSE